MEVPPEDVLARGLAAGDPEAWQSLYDLYAQPVWRFVARLMGPSTTEVPDVVQEAFLAAARSARTYNPEAGSLWNWLCGIARHHVALHFRKSGAYARVLEVQRSRQADRAQGDGGVHGTQSSPNPAAALEAAELATLVRATLTELGGDHGFILAVRYLEGASVQQIADAERCTLTAVRSRLARARQAFREKFSRMCAGTAEEIGVAIHEA